MHLSSLVYRTQISLFLALFEFFSQLYLVLHFACVVTSCICDVSVGDTKAKRKSSANNR
jgi:hypothetical protein